MFVFLALVDGDSELGLVVDFRDGADVRHALVDLGGGPIVPNHLVSDRVDVILGVEVVQLMGQELSDGEEDERTDAQNVLIGALGHHDLGHLSVLVSLDVNAPVNGQGGQLLVLLALGNVLIAVDGLILVKHGLVFAGAAHVIMIGAANLPTLDRGAVLLADLTNGVLAVLQGRFDVDQSPADGLVDFFRPEGAVQVHPLVHVVVEQSSRAVRGGVAPHVAEQTLAHVVGLPRGHHRRAHLEHHLGQFVLVQAFVLLHDGGSRR